MKACCSLNLILVLYSVENHRLFRVQQTVILRTRAISSDDMHPKKEVQDSLTMAKNSLIDHNDSDHCLLLATLLAL